jgi:poly-gamma-glutamate synthesis protein (capsule biosynthesis protein)
MSKLIKTLGKITASILLLTYCLLVYTSCNRTPSAESSTEEIKKTSKCDTVRLVFGGDLMQHGPQINAARTKSGFDYTPSFQYIAPIFESADVAVVNFETTLTRNQDYSGYPRFRSPIRLADAMANMGIDIALLANNHCLDGNPSGLATTIEEFEKRGIAFTGAFRNAEDHNKNNVVYFERKGIRFALVNYTYGTNGIPATQGVVVNYIDKEKIKQDLAAIDRNKVDCLIACMHWGNEYERRPNNEQKELAQLLKTAGVDIIIGGHPHVVQRYEVDPTGVLFYSLGNLVSNQRKRYCNGGLLAEVEVIRCDTTEHLQYKAKAHPVFVATPGYHILTKAVGDTLKMSQQLRQAYDTFMKDTEMLLSEGKEQNPN